MRGSLPQAGHHVCLGKRQTALITGAKEQGGHLLKGCYPNPLSVSEKNF